MVATKTLIALGLVCLVACASAQLTAESIMDPSSEAGDYVVDGTGVQYDANNINLVVNGTVIQTLPRNSAAPGPAPVKPKKDIKQEIQDKLAQFPKPTQGPMVPSPSGSPADVKGSLANPLNNIVIGRKLML